MNKEDLKKLIDIINQLVVQVNQDDTTPIQLETLDIETFDLNIPVADKTAMEDIAKEVVANILTTGELVI